MTSIILFGVLRCLQGYRRTLTFWQCSSSFWRWDVISGLVGLISFQVSFSSGAGEWLWWDFAVHERDSWKSLISVKNDASQNFVLRFTFSSYRHIFICSSSKHIEGSEFCFKGSKNGTQINSIIRQIIIVTSIHCRHVIS
jgi:hypothetical protein